ncbi:MAG: DNA-directed RNA polymerase subunit omega [Acidimicrobiales bacterium]|nr:DNA-directed RNA polymerase subunit omega [Acidimicrobiales bacterium]RZV48748.1 MAG: DNA-directed RNA polymerase subunit omega [Acidimicrobiales bacterium]
MIDPQVETLLELAGSKFRLVTLGSKRARQINAYFGQLGDGLGSSIPPQVTSTARKPLSIAFEEIAAKKIEPIERDFEAEALAEAQAAADAAALDAELAEAD